jgi:iron complex outermembrane recepter protein
MAFIRGAREGVTASARRGKARFHITALLLVTACLMASNAARAGDLDKVFAFNIEAQTLDKALLEFGAQAHVQIMFAWDSTAGRVQTAEVKGRYTGRGALTALLRGTRLRYSEHGDTVEVTPIDLSSSGSQKQQSRSADPEAHGPAPSLTDPPANQASGSHGKKTRPFDEKPQRGNDKTVLAEVVVTAEKRKELLQDVPVSVTALSGSTLVENGQLGLQDYYSSVPGLDFAMDNRGAPAISIRGITTGAYGTPTVGVTIDDVSFGSTVVVSSFSPAPDLDPHEIAQVEVLRGPQGTLYGANSIGGQINYVTVDPSTTALSGDVQVGGSAIQNGNGGGYSASGSVNLPLTDSLAMRANGFTYEDPGYIDNVETAQDGVNEIKVYGGRWATLWRPSDSITLKIDAILQRSKANGSSQVDSLPGLGDLQQKYLGGIGGYDRKIQAYSANLTAKVGKAVLKSITGYGRSNSSDSYDVSSALGGLGTLLFGVPGVAWAEDNETSKFSQELRLAMPLGERIDWLGGLLYTHEQTTPDGGFVAIDPATYQRVAQAEDQLIHETYEEYAAYTDFTLHLTDRLDVQFGGRESFNDQSYAITTSGPFVPIFFAGETSPVVGPEVHSRGNSFTYLVTPRFQLSHRFMVYGRFASGYRPGGPNAAAAEDPAIPRNFAPDKTQNFSLGTKGEFLDRRLYVDASAYYVLWRGIQLSLDDPTTLLSYTGNGSRAKSEGLELAAESRPLPGLTLSFWVVWNEAALTEPLPANSTAVGGIGSRLPYSSRFSGRFSVDEEFPIATLLGFVEGSVSYLGDRYGEFTGTPERQIYPPYAKTDFRIGVRHEGWMVNAYVNNVTNRRGVLAGGLGTFPAFAFNYIQPRTLGLSVSRKF